jgi:hypothetical protein
MIMVTNRAHISSMSIEHNELAFPPTDLLSRKAFIRTGQSAGKKRKAERKWQQIQSDVRRMAKAVQQHQHNGTAPKGVILYMEGLDCSGKSSTGGLVQAALDATSQQGHSNHDPGLTAIEVHIDPPTDFIAFNKCSEKLQNFCSVALNTDRNGYANPWFVVCTSKCQTATLLDCR